MKTLLSFFLFYSGFVWGLEPYRASYSQMTPEIYERNIEFWMEDNPVPLEDLRCLVITCLGFDDKPHLEEIVVHKDVAPELISIFEEIYLAEFPMEDISAFCSRAIRGSSRRFSKHSYGIAVDISPHLNPYIKEGYILPPNSEPFLDRDQDHPGLITESSPCYQAFAKRGWTWGGHWKTLKDYMHFEKRDVP